MPEEGTPATRVMIPAALPAFTGDSGSVSVSRQPAIGRSGWMALRGRQLRSIEASSLSCTGAGSVPARRTTISSCSRSSRVDVNAEFLAAVPLECRSFAHEQVLVAWSHQSARVLGGGRATKDRQRPRRDRWIALGRRLPRLASGLMAHHRRALSFALRGVTRRLARQPTGRARGGGVGQL